jgi:hypothetical protein
MAEDVFLRIAGDLGSPVDGAAVAVSGVFGHGDGVSIWSEKVWWLLLCRATWRGIEQ